MAGSSPCEETIGPLIRVIAPGLLELSAHTITDELLAEHFEAFGAFCRQNKSWIAVLVDLNPLMALPATQRRQIAAFKEDMAEHDRRYVAGFASVSPNRFVRGLMTAVYWWHPPVYPHRFVNTREAGLTWLHTQLDAQRGIHSAAG